MTATDTSAIFVTLQLAGATTALLMIFGTPVAWWVARSRSWFSTLLSPLISLPLVLPPTVIGFYLLILFSPDQAVGSFWLQMTGDTLAFSFAGLLIGSVIYSMPFYIQPLQVEFSNIDQNLIEAATTLGAGSFDRFFNLVVPLSARGFLIATTLTFAHTVGEFGIVLMIGGNIPGETRVLSIALYDHVETLQYARAHILAGGLMLFSFCTLILIHIINKGSLTVVAAGSRGR
ncbi:MAG TPA: molybdate ABC transporter permease subunit [Gammaproteobacteria bacterium]|nr:molybdate ABC transporter permease subunit [Gammaproteobacteria bacterium]HIK71117.1 molybdate ABC transporter permease subunit [Pseudomonadales bacterium]|tara:strand:+ start:288 stop:983 length:696 start_codon:yes stop_codon:yes gene_type:complete